MTAKAMMMLVTQRVASSRNSGTSDAERKVCLGNLPTRFEVALDKKQHSFFFVPCASLHCVVSFAVSKLEALRHVSRPRPVVDYKNLYVRYSDPERRAMDHFSFLEEYPSSGTQSEDETGLGSCRAKSYRGQGRGTTIKLGCGILDQAEHQTCGDGFGINSGRDGSSDANKRSSNSSDELTKICHVKPQHKTVLALKGESRQQGAANRFSNAIIRITSELWGTVTQ